MLRPGPLILQLSGVWPMATPWSRANDRRNRVDFPLPMQAVGVCQISSQQARCDDPHGECDDDDFEELPSSGNKNHVGLPPDVIRPDSAPLT